MFALPILTVRAIYRPAVASVQWTLAGRKSPNLSVGALVFALPIFTASHPATIVGVYVLNFCVRDGNRWTHIAINTNYDDGCSPSLYMLKVSTLLTTRIIAPQVALVNTFSSDV